MSGDWPVVDLLLAVGLVALAVRILAADDLFEAVVLLITFGLLMALTWSRLAAPDLALAEAAIGAGLTGALFLNALREMDDARGAAAGGVAAAPRAPLYQRPARLALLLVGGMLAGVLVLAVQGLGVTEGLMDQQVRAAMPQSGAGNPVTAVLLNFRGYDTLLEVVVLLVAVISAWTVAPAVPRAAPRAEAQPPAALAAMVQLVVPAIAVIGVYLLWAGKEAPGGAFQAGATWAGGAVLLLAAGRGHWMRRRRLAIRAALVVGPAAMITAAIGLHALQGAALQYPPDRAGVWMMVLETLLSVSIAATLVALFVAGLRGGPAGPPPLKKEPDPS